MGSPAVVRRPLTDAERDSLVASAERYVNYTQDYLPASESSNGGASE